MQPPASLQPQCHFHLHKHKSRLEVEVVAVEVVATSIQCYFWEGSSFILSLKTFFFDLQKSIKIVICTGYRALGMIPLTVHLVTSEDKEESDLKKTTLYSGLKLEKIVP